MPKRKGDTSAESAARFRALRRQVNYCRRPCGWPMCNRVARFRVAYPHSTIETCAEHGERAGQSGLALTVTAL